VTDSGTQDHPVNMVIVGKRGLQRLEYKHTATLTADQTVGSLVRNAREQLKEEGRAFLGAKGIRKQSPFRRAATPEKLGLMKPRFAARSSSVLVTAIVAWRSFQRAYRAALDEWRSGDHERAFPFGTYMLRRLARVRCAAADVVLDAT